MKTNLLLDVHNGRMTCSDIEYPIEVLVMCNERPKFKTLCTSKFPHNYPATLLHAHIEKLRHELGALMREDESIIGYRIGIRQVFGAVVLVRYKEPSPEQTCALCAYFDLRTEKQYQHNCKGCAKVHERPHFVAKVEGKLPPTHWWEDREADPLYQRSKPRW